MLKRKKDRASPITAHNISYKRYQRLPERDNPFFVYLICYLGEFCPVFLWAQFLAKLLVHHL